MTKLNIQFHFLSPVQVVKVTPKNLAEVAEWCGGKVARKESNRVPGRVDSYVEVPTPRGATISMAFPGMLITKRLAITEADEIKATFSVFRKDYFSKNYFNDPQAAVDATWERHDAEEKGAALMAQAIERGHITINISGVQSPQEIAARVQEAMMTEPTPNPVNVSAVVEEVFDTTDFQEPIKLDEEDMPLSPVEQRELILAESVETEAAPLDPHRA